MVLLDNMAVHHSSQIVAAVEQAGATVCFLPPYSPDYSPIEPCWAKVKTYLRGVAARSRRRLDRALQQALRSIHPAHADGWFRLWGYVDSLKRESL